MKTTPNTEAFVLIQMSIDSYRQKFLEELKSISDTKIFVGKNHFSDQVKTRVSLDYQPVRNLFLFRRKLAFQIGTLTPGIWAKKVVIEMNPRVLSNWLILLIRRILLKESTLWGHFLGRQDNQVSQGLGRRLMIVLAGGSLIAYTESEGIKFQQAWPHKKVSVAPNSLVRECEMNFNGNSDRHDFVYSGRLSMDKNPDILLRAFARFLSLNESPSKLHIVGDGEMEVSMKLMADNLGLTNRVVFHGFISDHHELMKIYDKCISAVIAGFVGLSAVQALGFGVPLIYPAKSKYAHAPEVELLHSKNSIVSGNDYTGFTLALISAYNERAFWKEMGPMIVQELKTKHTVERMSSGFLNAI